VAQAVPDDGLALTGARVAGTWGFEVEAESHQVYWQGRDRAATFRPLRKTECSGSQNWAVERCLGVPRSA